MSERQPVRSIGGIAMYSGDPETLAEWYRLNLGIITTRSPVAGALVHDFYHREVEDPQREWRTVWAILPLADQVAPEPTGFRITYRVTDLADFVRQLGARGIEIEREEEHAYGRSAWIQDPEGRSIELWED